MINCPNCGTAVAIAEGLTPRQGELLKFIVDYQSKHGGISPSYDEMMAAVGLKSKSRIHYLMRGLRERGRVVWTPAKSRTVTVLAA